MVRTHVLSAKLPRWRSGVILEFEENRALVRADSQDRKIFHLCLRTAVRAPSLARNHTLGL